MDPDEPWDFYDWHLVDPGDAVRLRALLGSCPDPLGPECQCAVHAALRATFKALPRAKWSGFAANAHGYGTEVHHVGVEIENGLPRLVVRDRRSTETPPS